MAKKVQDDRGSSEHIFSEYDQLYEKHGLVGVPLIPGQKRPGLRNWQQLASITPLEREELRRKSAKSGIGLLAGTSLSSGRTVSFIDVDHPGFVNFVKSVVTPFLSGKRGAKGETIFAQAEGGLKSTKLKPKGAKFPVVELFITSGLTAIPPSRHPSGCHYEWIGSPLLEVDLKDLPVLSEERFAIISAVAANKNAMAIVEGGPSIKAHDHMLSLTSSGIAQLTDDLEGLADNLNALFHPGYDGNTKAETLGMLRSAREKGLGRTARSKRRYNPGDQGPIPLGYTREGNSANQLLSLQYLVGLVSSDYWAAQFPSEKGLFSFLAAGEALIAASKQAGPFNLLKVRGRGIWREGDKIVINLGGAIPEDLKHIYLCFEPIRFDEFAAFDTQRLLDLLRLFKWRNPQDAMLLLGWLALAPICGVLDWRPHAFVYGPPRCGKTTIHLVAASLLTPLVISTDGQSSEAGIRQSLGPDSLPIIIDEFESDQHGSGLRGVLRLARSASSADNPVLRGTPEGKAMQFSLRTTFFFSAVNPGRMSPADQTRILLLELLQHDNDEAVARQIGVEESYFRELGPKWCGYMVSLAGILGTAVDSFIPMMPSADRRHRQNLATLLASAFVALHGRVPSPEEASAWATEYSPAVELHAEDIHRDNAAECLEHLLAHVVDQYPLGHWIAVAKLNLSTDDRRYYDAERVMRIYDIVVRSSDENPGVLIRNGSPKIEEVYQNTIWEGRGWERALRALEGAFSLKNPVYFSGARQKSRCVGIPLDRIPEPIEMADDNRDY